MPLPAIMLAIEADPDCSVCAALNDGDYCRRHGYWKTIPRQLAAPVSTPKEDALTMYYEWARSLPTAEQKADAALELCHMLIIALANHVHDLHPGSLS